MRIAVRGFGALSISLVVAISASAGCGQGDRPPPEREQRATATTDASDTPVAYELPTGAARRLAAADATRVLEREGRVVATSEWDVYTAVVLSEWLDHHGVRLDVPSDLRSVVRRVANEQELPLLVVSSEHRRYSEALARMRPTAHQLRSFYERFTGERSAEAGRAMRDWLRVFRRAVEAVDAEHLVVIPVPD
jgi:hypothetical protein